jgi:hypothetical protein
MYLRFLVVQVAVFELLACLLNSQINSNEMGTRLGCVFESTHNLESNLLIPIRMQLMCLHRTEALSFVFMGREGDAKDCHQVSQEMACGGGEGHVSEDS